MGDQIIQVFSIIGSLLILGAFVATQAGRMRSADLSYLMMNFVGSAILGVVAVIESQWGFILLESVWALVSLWSALKLLRGSPRTDD